MTNLLIGSINTQGPWFHASGEGVTACALDEATGRISRIGQPSGRAGASFATGCPMRAVFP